MSEVCRSPLNPDCGRRDIQVYILFGGRKLPVCGKCWEQIADSDLEWEEGESERKLKRKAEEERRKLHQKLMEEAMRKALMAEAKRIAAKARKVAGKRG